MGSCERIIWQFWGNPDGSSEPPEYLKRCIQTVKKNLGCFEHRLLTWEDIPEELLEISSKGFSRNHPLSISTMTNILRVGLLKGRGGVWIDADTILFRPLDRIFDECCEERKGFFAGEVTARPGRYKISTGICGSAKDGSVVKTWLQYINKLNGPPYLHGHTGWACLTRSVLDHHIAKKFDDYRIFSQPVFQPVPAAVKHLFFNTHVPIFEIIKAETRAVCLFNSYFQDKMGRFGDASLLMRMLDYALQPT